MSDSEYISRDAVDTKLLAMEERFIDNPFALTAIAMAMDKIDKIPAADVAPVVHGHWVEVDSDGSYCVFCSKCRTAAHPITDLIHPENWLYCPHCGAKMDEREDSTDE